MHINPTLRLQDLHASALLALELAGRKAERLDDSWDPGQGTPVFTAGGRYTTRGWTEWTQGFQYGLLILAGDGLDRDQWIELGRRRTVERMLPHVTHIGVHDHGFNNLSTYGNLLRLMSEGRLAGDTWQRAFYEQAIAVSGAVQAARWSETNCGLGYIYSFNGPHSLFIDTMRTLRVLGVAHQLGHRLMGENDRSINLLGRLIQHALATSRYLVFHGETTQTFDVRGRTAHEGTFNRVDGRFRSRATQQGYSPFSTWTRGLAWAMLGYAEELEFLKQLEAAEIEQACQRAASDVLGEFERCARQTCDHWIEEATAADGVPPWDDGAPQLHRLGDWRAVPADPYNDFEPVDSSAAAIAAQALLRLGQTLGEGEGTRYRQAGLTVAGTLLAEPYLATGEEHDGLLLHSIYHWPNHWDHVPSGRRVACGESSMWGDYHLAELALLLHRMAAGGPYPTFFSSSQRAVFPGGAPGL